MTEAWIASAPALAQVVAVELNPEVAAKKLVEAIRRGTMPAKVTMPSGERFLSPELFPDHGCFVKIDWAAGTGLYKRSHFVQGEPPLAEWTFRDLLLSRRHVDESWPSTAPAERPAAPVKGAGGAPSKWDWEGALIEMGRIAANEVDAEPNRAMLNDRIAQWFVAQTGSHPTESQIRERVKRFHHALWPPRV